MRFFGIELSSARRAEAKTAYTLDQIIQRLDAANASVSGVSVTPENCMQSPTMQAVVQAISRRIATLPVKVYRVSGTADRPRRQEDPDHPVAKLLRAPSPVCDRTTFWLDATSSLIRWGNLVCLKERGSTGPIRNLVFFPMTQVAIEAHDAANPLKLEYRLTWRLGGQQVYGPDRVMHARLGSRDGLIGDSPVIDLRDAIAMEIAAEKMAGTVFGNNALPGLVFQFAEGFAGFKTDEERTKFVAEFTANYGKQNRFASFMLPKGIEIRDAMPIENEKAQFLQTRQFQRSVIAGGFGVPPHLVGDLTKGTFNNVEQQSIDFVNSAVMPFIRVFEAAMDRSLLTDEDRRAGTIIRFDLSEAFQGDFKSRQEGLNLQRMAGVINANEWREREGLNPISTGDGGEEYYKQGPSGQNADPKASEPTEEKPDDEDEPAQPKPGTEGAK